MKWYIHVLNNYVNFEGRARREEYWMFTLFHLIFIFLLVIIPIALFDSPLGTLPVLIYFLATFLPTLAVTIRRLHDTGKSGWFYLITFIPYLGGLILLIFTVENGNKGQNKYGPDPKGRNDEEIEDIGKPILDN
ncbi:hypothetical protein A9Q87_01180 [Flavobacteriales bacterium 34_180_T64]|nr:hypothetical protein A9Q87_01180 [Flavobacteriales bacterium 34_180_T64]